MPVGREVEVTLSQDEAPLPVAFRLGSRRYRVAEQMASWPDRKFAGRRRGGDWRQQQERWYYRVRTEEGEVYELYTDWSPRRRRKEGARTASWHLHRQLSIAAAEGEFEVAVEAEAEETEAEKSEAEKSEEEQAPSG